MTDVRRIDDKGRITLGRQFAGRRAVVSEREDELVLTFQRLVPDREAWLHENPEAYAMVRRGLDQAERGELVDAPDLAADADFADSIPDDAA